LCKRAVYICKGDLCLCVRTSVFVAICAVRHMSHTHLLSYLHTHVHKHIHAYINTYTYIICIM
jgi:hypothetical protein